MQVDQAGWHRAKDLQVEDEYSFDLSAREKYLHNRIFPSLEDLIEVLCRALTELTDDTQRLRSMMFFPHFRTES